MRSRDEMVPFADEHWLPKMVPIGLGDDWFAKALDSIRTYYAMRTRFNVNANPPT